MSNIDKIKDRIRQMLAIASNDASSDGEIDNAIRFARNLMDQHRLSENDLVVEPADQKQAINDAPKDRAFVTIGGKIYAWESQLAHAVGQIVGCPFYTNGDKTRLARSRAGYVRFDAKGEAMRGKSIVFYGIAEDAWLAAELYEELRTTIITLARLKWGGCYKGDGGRYAEGFVDGINSKITSQEKQERINATGVNSLILIERRNDLVVHTNRVARNWLTSQGVRLSKGTPRPGANGSANAYGSGVADGQRSTVNVSRAPKIE